MYKWLYVLCCITSLCFLQSCGSSIIQQDKLVGEWGFEKGKLNGDSTQANDMFKPFFVKFTADHKMSSNMFPEFNLPAELPYTIQGNQLVLEGNALSFEVKEMNALHLHLIFGAERNEQHYDFEMMFKKK